MLCNRCGKKVKKGVAFCPSCGEKIVTTNSIASNQDGEATQVSAPKGKSKRPVLFKSIIIGVGLLVVALVGVWIIDNNIKSVINANEYVSIEFTGYDGYGSAGWKYAKDQFVEDYKGKISFTNGFEKALKERDDMSELCEHWANYGVNLTNPAEEDAAEFLYFILFRSAPLSSGTGLSNGETVTFVWDIEERYTEEELLQICELLKVKLNYTDIEFVVSGLTEVPKFDPFDGVEVSYSGASPNGHVLLANYPTNGLYYSLDAPAIVSNGDEFTITASYEYNMEEYVNMYGKIPNSTEKTYVVADLPEYMTSASQIPEEVLAEMQAQSEDIIKATTARWISGYNLDISYIGNYMLMAKNPEEFTQNMFVLLYKMHYVNSFEDYNGNLQEYSKDYYFFVNWDNLIINNDGTCLYDINSYRKASDYFQVNTGIYKNYNKYWGESGEHTLVFKGYETLDEIYSYFITTNIENYRFEENIQE